MKERCVPPHHSTTRIAALDGLRGVAIILVITAHAALVQPVDRIDVFFAEVSHAGWIGVDLFFVLSGFLITGILLDTKRGSHYLSNFYIRRVLRIFPLYYCSLVILFVVVPLVGPLLANVIHTSAGLAQFRETQSQLRDNQLWYWFHATNLLVLRRGTVSALPVATGQFWSLAVEEQFYLVWPFVVLFASRKACAWIFTGCVALSFLLRIVFWSASVPSDVVYTFTLTRCDPLALGALVALAWRSPMWWPRARGVAWWMLAASSFGICLVWAARGGLNSRDRLVQECGLILIAVFFGSLLVRILSRFDSGTRGGVLIGHLLRSLGRYSYAIYIIHQGVLVLVWHALPWNRFPLILGSSVVQQIVLTSTVTAASLGIASLIWRFYEQPFLRLKERVTSGAPSHSVGNTASRLSGAV